MILGCCNLFQPRRTRIACYRWQVVAQKKHQRHADVYLLGKNNVGVAHAYKRNMHTGLKCAQTSIFHLFDHILYVFCHITRLSGPQIIDINVFKHNRCIRRSAFANHELTRAEAACTKRKPILRNSQHDFLTATEIASLYDSLTDQPDQPYILPKHMGGKRKSSRLALKAEIIEIKSCILALQELEDLLQPPPPQQPETAPPVPAVLPNPVAGPAVDPTPEWSHFKRRRMIQCCYELRGAPHEITADGSSCWEGKHGLINSIHKVLHLGQSWRVRLIIRQVMQFVRDALDAGEDHIDAGPKRGRRNSGRKRKLHDTHDRYLLSCV